MKDTSILSNLMWRFAERILAQGVSTLVSIVLARLLLPEDYGVISMVMIFITFANVLVTTGFSNALVQKKNAEEVDYSSAFYLTLVTSIVIYAILFFSAPFIAEYFSMPVLRPVLRVLSFRIIITSVNSIQHAYVAKHMMFRKYFWSTLFGTLLSCGVGLILAVKGFGVWALVAQYLTNTFTDTIVLFITVSWRPRLLFSWESISQLFKYGWKLLVEGISETFYSQVRNLVIGRVYSSEKLGFYTKAQQFPDLLMNNILSSISSVLFPAMSNIQDDNLRVKGLLRKSVRLSSYVIFPILLGLALVAEPFVVVILTDKWIECVPFIYVFCFIKMTEIALICRHQALQSIGRSDVFMVEHIFPRIVSMTCLLFVYKESVMAVALSSVVGNLIMVLTVAYTSKRFNGYEYKEQILDVLPAVLACGIMAIPVIIVGRLDLTMLSLLALQIMAGMVTYIVASWLLKLPEFYEVISIIRLLVRRGK